MPTVRTDVSRSAEALVLTAATQFEQRRLPVEQGPGEVLVRVTETGLCGSDVTMYLGRHPVNRPPLVLGHEFYGELLTAAPGADARPGDAVAVFPALSCGGCAACLDHATNLCAQMGIVGAQRPGALAGLVAVPAGSVRAFDPGTPPAVRVLSEPLAVALHACDRAGAAVGARVAVLGAGTIGTLVAALLSASDAAEVIVVDSNPQRLAAIERLGIGSVRATEERPLNSVLGSDQGRLDLVIDCVGSAELAEQAVAATRPGGTVVLVGVQTGAIGLDGVALQRGERAVTGVQLYTIRDFRRAMDLLAYEPTFRDLPVGDLIRRNRLADAASVFDRLANGRSQHLKETIVFD